MKPTPPAKDGVFGKIVKTLTAAFSDKEIEASSSSSSTKKINPRLSTASTREELVQIAARSSRTNDTQARTQLINYIKNKAEQISKDRIENLRLIMMNPEITQAANVIVPSILSPDDLKQNPITILTSAGIDNTKKDAISQILTEHFDEYEHLSTSVIEWIYEYLFVSGGRPVIIIPLVALKKMMTDRKNMLNVQSTEALLEQDDKCTTFSLFGITSVPTKEEAANKNREIFSTESLSGVERHIASELPMAVDANGRPIKPKEKTVREKAIASLAKEFLATENLVIVDNPQYLGAPIVSNQDNQNKIKTQTDRLFDADGHLKKGSKNTRILYSEAPTMTIDEPDPSEDPIGNPLVITPPPESFIPLYTPGTPNERIGAILVVDEYGTPIDLSDYLDSDPSENISSSSYSVTSNISALYQAYGYSGDNDYRQGQGIVTDVYQSIVEEHIKATLKKGGYHNIAIGSNSSIFKCMLARFFQQRKTRLVFIPGTLFTYFCNKTAPDGTGVSLLEGLKYILSLKTTLQNIRMMVAFNNALNRRKIDITFPEKYAGNYLEHLYTAQREAAKKEMITWSNDPTQTISQLISKSYTIRGHNLPGNVNYEVTNEENLRQTPTPDTGLADDLSKALILGLGVPPSAMGSDADFSRAIAVSSLMFSRLVVQYQSILEPNLSNYARNYTKHSLPLRKKIMNVLNGTTGDDESKSKIPTDDPGTITSDTGDDEDTQTDLDEVINGIYVQLPKPSVAPDRAQFDNLSSLAQSLDDLMSKLYNPDVSAGNTELTNTINAVKAIELATILRNKAKDIGFTDYNIPDMGEIDTDIITGTRQNLINIYASIKSQLDSLGTGVGLSTSADGSSGGMDMGGGTGMGGSPDMGGGMPPSDDSGDTTDDTESTGEEPEETDTSTSSTDTVSESPDTGPASNTEDTTSGTGTSTSGSSGSSSTDDGVTY